MYSTPAYLYQQIQTVLLVDVSGSYFDRRWNPVYAKNLTINRGVDNVLLFQFLNQDQKPVNISGATFTFRVISQNGEQLLLAKDLDVLSATAGRAKVTVTAAETLNLEPDLASYSISMASGVLDRPVFVDDNSGARGVVNIVDSVFPSFVASRVLTIPDQAPDSSIYYSSTLNTDGTRLTTFQIDTNTFTGSLQVQGATTTDGEWYTIPFQDLESGNTVEQLSLDSNTQRRGINVSGFHPLLRLELDITDGNIDLITYR
jgi:hypothetical protein